MGITRVARRNLGHAFPNATEAEKQKIITDMWDNLGRVIAEYPHLRRLWDRVEVVGEEHIRQAATAGTATIFFGAHIGNWEINALSARHYGIPIELVYRKPNNPYVDRLLRHARAADAVSYIPKGIDGARGVLSALKKNRTVGMLLDQKMNEGVPVPFFGRDAMTAPAIAQFALKMGCPLYSSFVERLPGARFRMTIYPPMKVSATGDKDADIRRVLVDINTRIEGWVRAQPGQWLWIHRRWPDKE
jgi:KDO2-lipid IV(A) lauroyltransferase